MPITDVLTPAVMVGLNAPTAEAVCLPGAAYTSDDYLNREREVLFGDDWTFAAVGAQIPKRGDVLPVDVAGFPVVLVRNRDGSIKAFHNVCRHRGLKLVSEPCSGKSSLVCPYHSWTYNLEGDLKKTPHFGGHDCHKAPGFSNADYGLHKVQCELWNDMVFVNLNNNARPFIERVAPLNERWASYDFSLLRHGGSATFEANCNWKLAIENFLESYHLPWTHPGLNSYSLMQDHFNVVEPTHIGQGSSAYNAAAAGHGDLPQFPDLPSERQSLADYPHLSPNLMLGLHPSYLFVFAVMPVSVNQTREFFHFYFVGDAALKPELEEQRQSVMSAWASINAEDILMIEGMQQGRLSPGYGDGRFSPYHEITTHEFQRRAANRLLAAEPAAMTLASAQLDVGD